MTTEEIELEKIRKEKEELKRLKMRNSQNLEKVLFVYFRIRKLFLNQSFQQIL